MSVELVAGIAAEPAEELGSRLQDPNTGADRGPMRATAAARLDTAVAHAQRAWTSGSWSGRPIEERAAVLGRFADALEEQAEAIALADALESGVPIAITRMVAGSLGGQVRATAELALRELRPERLDGPRHVELLKLPWGPVALITPWNAPAALAVSKIANALAAGCPAILKPSEHAPGSASIIADIWALAGLPDDALQVVHGGAPTAAALAGDPRIRMVHLTGGAGAGRALMAAAAAARTKLHLELGASNPAIVTADADIAEAAEHLARGATKLNGQWCEAPRRVLVDRRRHDELVDALRVRLTAVRIGSSVQGEADMGPLSHEGHRARVEGQVRALGGDAVTTAPLPDLPGWFLSPTVVTGLAAGAVREEIFGPVLTLHAVEDDAEALAAANALGDGLDAYVFAGDEERAFALGRALHAGEVKLGGTSLLDLHPDSEQSFWGSSGLGGHGARRALDAYVGRRIVGQDDPELPI